MPDWRPRSARSDPTWPSVNGRYSGHGSWLGPEAAGGRPGHGRRGRGGEPVPPRPRVRCPGARSSRRPASGAGSRSACPSRWPYAASGLAPNSSLAASGSTGCSIGLSERTHRRVLIACLRRLLAPVPRSRLGRSGVCRARHRLLPSCCSSVEPESSSGGGCVRKLALPQRLISPAAPSIAGVRVGSPSADRSRRSSVPPSASDRGRPASAQNGTHAWPLQPGSAHRRHDQMT